MDRRSQNNYANQKNPNNGSYWGSRNGQSSKTSSSMSKQEQDNRSRQMNPNHSAYYQSRGYK